MQQQNFNAALPCKHCKNVHNSESLSQKYDQKEVRKVKREQASDLSVGFTGNQFEVVRSHKGRLQRDIKFQKTPQTAYH